MADSNGPLLLTLALVLGCGVAEPRPVQPSAGERPTKSLDALELTDIGHESFERLLNARRFTDDAIGDGGITPNEVRALRYLVREDNAMQAFVLLEERATLPGRLYALCALYELDPQRFGERVGAYRSSDATIEVQMGCTIFGDYPVAQLVALPEDRAVRLAPGETNRDPWPEGGFGGLKSALRPGRRAAAQAPPGPRSCQGVPSVRLVGAARPCSAGQYLRWLLAACCDADP